MSVLDLFAREPVTDRDGISHSLRTVILWVLRHGASRPGDAGRMPDCGVGTTLRPVAVAFVVFGFFAGAWAVATVDIERTFHLTDAGLGALLAAGIVAATAVAAIGGAVTDRFGARSLVDARAGASGACCSSAEASAPHLVLFVPGAAGWQWPRAGSSTS